MSLYRTYRPKSFEDVTAQESIVTTLKNAVAQDKIAHAYLFAGPRGTGKTSLARILARELVTKGIDDPLLKDQITKGVEDGSLVDVIEIDAASNRGIEDIRDLIEKIQFSPLVATAKVYIIDEVHMLTREAFNALLKTLEEPPSYAYFILATTEMQKIPATIQSRCQRFIFTHIQSGDIVSRLRFIADKEGITIDDTALASIAKSAQGGMRDAISLLDQLRSLASITSTDVEARTGTLGHEHVAALLVALQHNDRPGIVEGIRAAEETGMAMETLARQLLVALREELHRAVTANASIEQISAKIEHILSGIKDLRVSPVPALALESALLSMTDVPQAPIRQAQGDTPAAREMETVTASRPLVETKREPIVTVTEAPPFQSLEPPLVDNALLSSITPNPTLPAGHSSAERRLEPDLSLTAIKLQWPTIVDSATPASVKMSLKNGHVTDLKNNILTMTFTSAFHRDRVAQTDSSTMLENLLEQTFGTRLRFHGVVDTEKIAPTPQAVMVDLAEAAADVF